MKRNKLVAFIAATLAAAILCVCLWRVFCATPGDMLRSVVVVEHAEWNEITVDGHARLYFSGVEADTGFVGLTTQRTGAVRHSLQGGCWVNRYAALPLCGGRIMTVYASDGACPPVQGDSSVARLCRMATGKRLKTLTMQKSELDYYMRVHGVQDYGYQTIAALADKVSAEYADAARVAHIVDSLLSSGRHRLAVRHCSEFRAVYRDDGGTVRRVKLKVLRRDASHATMVLQTADAATPSGVCALSLWPWLSGGQCAVVGVGCPGLGMDGLECDTVSPMPYTGLKLRGAIHDMPSLLVPDGSPVFGSHGRFLGIAAGRCIVRTGSSAQTVARAGCRRGGTPAEHARKVYRGTLKDGRYDGYGVLSVADSVLYAGQWRGGRRWGRGVSHDSLHHRIVGVWRADTLVSGSWRDSTGTYSGQLNRDAIASGYGSFIAARGDFYYGQWRDGARQGFGFALTHGKHIRVGEWRADRYLGERLEYTADRIYGIDVSRFQHDVGRRRYPIDWSRVRITHLGTISRKKVAGRIDYPVSFCYVKSTEGTSLRNSYYAADSRAARAHGIRVGAYHFFSTRTPAAQQAQFFLRNSSFHKGDLPPVLDVEPTREQIARMGGVQALFRAVRTWLRIVGSHTGTRPVLYISQTFVNRYLPSAPDLKRDYNIWIARYGEYKPDVHLVYWQLCPDGRVRGIHPEVDINVFNGYRAEFDDFLRRECVK